MENNPKRENLLNLALDASPRELEKSYALQEGYHARLQTWELIVRASTPLKQLEQEFPEASFVQLANGYGIVTIPQEQIEALTARTEIEYIEKPKRLFFTVDQGKRASCILPVQAGGLSGRGVLCGIADSGIDWKHPDFRREDGSTRIRALWDQTLAPRPEEGLRSPDGYDRGVLFTEDQINEALQGLGPESTRSLLEQSVDVSGHGTHVAGIAAGNGRASLGLYRGVAYESDLLIVRLGRPREDGFPSTTELMLAVDYLVLQAREWQEPIAINLSFGNNYGSHSGTSLLETFLNSFSGYWKNVIVTGTGNEGAKRIHTSGDFTREQDRMVEFAIAPYESSLSIQLWKSYSDDVDIRLIAPSGQSVGPISKILGPQRFVLENTEILLYYGEPGPYSPYQEIYLELLPVRQYLDSGIWGIGFQVNRAPYGRYDLWLPGAGSLNYGSGFLYPTEQTTLTIPSTAEKVISVAAYDSRRNQAADFSGRGFTRQTNQVKPDLAAPGVDIRSASPGGGYTVKSGTSMAAPFVTGSAALLMQWGIVEGRDPYLYGEKIKAYLIRGARPLPGFTEYPNPQIGWGTLCLSDSIP